jgi:hypothetical protein
LRQLSQYQNTCVFEKNVLKQFYSSLNDKYNLEDNPQILLLVDELVKLKLYDTKIMLINNKNGVFTEGEKGVRMAPGMHYSMSVADKISAIMEKIDKMFYHYPETKVNINVLSVKDILGEASEEDLQRKKLS